MRFETKIAIVVREDLATWQKLNVTAFLASAIAASDAGLIGEPYEDADGVPYLSTLRQPVMVFAADSGGIRTAFDRAHGRNIRLMPYTVEMFSTGHDAANREAVKAVGTAQLDLAGFAFLADRRDADKVTKGLKLHP